MCTHRYELSVSNRDNMMTPFSRGLYCAVGIILLHYYHITFVKEVRFSGFFAFKPWSFWDMTVHDCGSEWNQISVFICMLICFRGSRFHRVSDPLPLTPIDPSFACFFVVLANSTENASRIVGSDRDVSRDSAKENHGDSDQSCNTFLYCDLLISHLHGSGKRKWKWMRLVIDFIGNVRGISPVSTHCTEMLTCLFWR